MPYNFSGFALLLMVTPNKKTFEICSLWITHDSIWTLNKPNFFKKLFCRISYFLKAAKLWWTINVWIREEEHIFKNCLANWPLSKHEWQNILTLRPFLTKVRENCIFSELCHFYFVNKCTMVQMGSNLFRNYFYLKIDIIWLE